MARESYATVDLAAIRHNYRQLKTLAPLSRVMAVVKANAYGHGAIAVAKCLDDIADAFAVACSEEAIELRQEGVTQPILLLEGFFEAAELNDIVNYDLWCVIHNEEQAKIVIEANLPKPISVWLKMDTGMHRLGLQPEKYVGVWQMLSASSNVSNIVNMSHFASADEPNTATTAQQFARFHQVCKDLPGEVSLANSAATLVYGEYHADWVRPGIALYGANPVAGVALDLKPAMTLTAKVIAERWIESGDMVGYNGTWWAQQATKIATVAIGYADGYPRHAQNGTPVFLNGKKTCVVGRVSMDMVAIDVSMFDESVIGEDVEFWGVNVDIHDVARFSDTISYELYCGVNTRLYRRYIN